MNWLLTVVVKAVLEWLTSLLVRLREKEELRQEGREQVKDELDKQNTAVKKEIDTVLDGAPTDVDSAIRQMRERSKASGDY